MIEQVMYILRDIFLIVGALAVVIGAIGILRFPDFFSRVHAAGVTETAGVGLIIFGLFIEAGFTLTTAKLLIILLLILLTGPTASHALAKAAIHGGLSPLNSSGGNKSSNS